MTKESLASLLNGREYRSEITKIEAAQAASEALVVVFGYSDDNIEFRGAIYDEQGCFDGGTIEFTKDGIFKDYDDMEVLEKYKSAIVFNKIEAIWEPQAPDCAWTYETSIPHCKFDIIREGELYCVGIVFNVSDLK